jgi:hypothetical protein
MPTLAELQNLERLLRRFVEGGATDHSLAAAGRVESEIVSVFGEDERFDDVLHGLALYRPGGGEYLFGESQIVPLCAEALATVRALLDDLKSNDADISI